MKKSEPRKAKKARFYGSVTGLYLLTLLFAWRVFLLPDKSYATVQNLPGTIVSAPPKERKVVSGKPTRIVIATLNVDLPVDSGFYNNDDGSWTLSGYHAQFATITRLANDWSGNTFVYGHNNKYVFGPLKSISPETVAEVYTDNGHVFTYKYQRTIAAEPQDTSIFDYQGPPILTIQTCSGNWNEKRQMYTFGFEKVGP